MRTAHLYGLPYSPWTERARWALDHQGVAHRFHEHVPMLGEALLRFRSGAARGVKVTAPLLVAEDATYGDSIDIIVRADRDAQRKLAPDPAELRALGDAIEPALAATRARVTARILEDPAALRESATAAVPGLLAGVFAPVAAAGTRFIMKKYGVDAGALEQGTATMRDVLTHLATKVDVNDTPTKERLTAVHILAATALQGVKPVDAAHMTLGPAVRRAWTHEALAEELAPFVAWRDRVYASARGTPG